MVTDGKGKKHKRKKCFYGTKMHTSINTEAKMITSVKVSSGNGSDGDCLIGLIGSDSK